MKCYLEPGRPQYTKEADVCKQVINVRDRVVGGECCEVGHKEKIEEEFDRIGFVSLREDKVLLIGASQW